MALFREGGNKGNAASAFKIGLSTAFLNSSSLPLL
jgi:hypothetical protein